MSKRFRVATTWEFEGWRWLNERHKLREFSVGWRYYPAPVLYMDDDFCCSGGYFVARLGFINISWGESYDFAGTRARLLGHDYQRKAA